MKTILTTAFMLTACLQVQAGGLEPKEVAADAQWMVHIDMEAAMKTIPGQQCLKTCTTKESAIAKIEKITEKIGFNPLTEFHSVTMYGRTLEMGQGTVIVKANYNQKHLEGIAKKQAGYSASRYGKYVLHSVPMKHHGRGDDDSSHQIVGCFYSKNTIVMGSSSDEVKHALNILSGKGSSLSGSDSPLLVKAPTGTTIQAGAVNLKEMKWPKQIPDGMRINGFLLATGEYKGKSFGQLVMATKTEQAAKQIKAMADGGKAMMQGRLKSQSKSAAEMLKQIEVEAVGATLSVEWEFDTTKLMKLMDEMKKRYRR